MDLLTPQQVAEKLKLHIRTVKKLGLPVVRVGARRGVLRYRLEDLEEYIRQRVEYPRVEMPQEEKEKKVRGPYYLRSRQVGVPSPISWKTIQEIKHQHRTRNKSNFRRKNNA